MPRYSQHLRVELLSNKLDYQIIHYPHASLSQKASIITQFDDNLINISNTMLKLMYEANGIGLAGNQIDYLYQIAVVDLQEDDIKSPIVIINPTITFFSEESSSYNEGCLSIKNVYADVVRPEEITLSYQNLRGEVQTLQTGGLLSRCIQHEVDHLNGILFINHLSQLKKTRLLKKYNKQNKG